MFPQFARQVHCRQVGRIHHLNCPKQGSHQQGPLQLRCKSCSDAERSGSPGSWAPKGCPNFYLGVVQILQEGPKRLQKEGGKESKVPFRLPSASQHAPRVPKRPSRGPQERPKRLQRDFQEDAKTFFLGFSEVVKKRSKFVPRFSFYGSEEAPNAIPARRPPPRATDCIACFTISTMHYRILCIACIQYNGQTNTGRGGDPGETGTHRSNRINDAGRRRGIETDTKTLSSSHRDC